MYESEALEYEAGDATKTSMGKFTKQTGNESASCFLCFAAQVFVRHTRYKRKMRNKMFRAAQEQDETMMLMMREEDARRVYDCVFALILTTNK